MSADIPQSPFNDSSEPEAGATAKAVASWTQDFEEKILKMLSHHHDLMMSAIHAGQTTLLRRYQEELERHTEFWRTLGELQETTHRTANHVMEHNAKLREHDKQMKLHDEQMKFHDERLRTLERWRYDMTPGTQPPPPDPANADLPRDR